MKKIILSFLLVTIVVTCFSQKAILSKKSISFVNPRAIEKVKPPTFNSEFTSMMDKTEDAIIEMANLGIDGPEDSALASPYLKTLMGQILDIADGLSRFGPVPTNIDGWVQIQYAHQAGVCIQNCYKDYYECLKNYEHVAGLGNLTYICSRDFHYCVIGCP